MKREDIRIRDPFILPHEGKYYMFGTGTPRAEDINAGRQFWCYISEDLENWSEPVLCFDAPEDFWGQMNFWAPEVHRYNGKFYMLASFYAEGKMRATQALVAERPEGPYRVAGQPLTPEDWMCLDGTLHVEDGVPYLVFCHEWLQTGDGEIAAVPLKADLSAPAGPVFPLFRAGESGWAQPITVGEHTGIVTDGPWLMRSKDALLLLWSSFREGAYAVGVAISESGKLAGPWKHADKLLFDKDGGHGMAFWGFDGQLRFAMHRPNQYPFERAVFLPLKMDNGIPSIKEV